MIVYGTAFSKYKFVDKTILLPERANMKYIWFVIAILPTKEVLSSFVS